VGERLAGGIRERGMVKVQETIEEALAGVRDGLAKMENDVVSLQWLWQAIAQLLTGDGSTLPGTGQRGPRRG
jgi:hypothetical protein